MENRPIKILFLASDPSDAARLRLGNESREIQDRLDDKDKFELKDRWAVRTKDVLRTIVDIKPQIVHFAGHGMETGELCFEDEQGNTKRVQPEALAALFRMVAEHVKCVVINTCFSEEQAKAIAEHILFVIGMKQAIEDKAAIEFAAGFYTALEADQSIENIEKAFELGCVSIQLDGIPAEDLTPVLIFGDPRKRFRSEVEQVLSRLHKTDSISAKIYRKALQEKGKHMELSPEEVESTINEVLELIKEFNLNLQKYEQTFTEAMRSEFPLEEKTRKALQYLQRELGLRDEDVASIESKITSDPRWESSEAFFDRGLTHFGLGEYQKALKYYTQALKIKSTYSGASLERGATYYKLGDMQAAIEDYNHAIETNSNWEGRSLSDAYLERGLAYFYYAKKEEFPQNIKAAIRDWTETIKLRPNYSIAYYNRACAYSALDNSEEAIKDYTEAININRDWGAIRPAHAYYKRGVLYRALGKSEAANEDFREAKELLKTKPASEDLFTDGGEDLSSKEVM